MNRWSFIKRLTKISYALGIALLLVGFVLSQVNQPVSAESETQRRPTVGPGSRSTQPPTNNGNNLNGPRTNGRNQTFSQPNARGVDAIQAGRVGIRQSFVDGYDVVWVNSQGTENDMALSCEFLNPSTVTASVNVTMPPGETHRLKVDYYWVHPANVDGYMKDQHVSNQDVVEWI